jgi:mannose-6-phosphate isomerase-like protein (cupin superfamily)
MTEHGFALPAGGGQSFWFLGSLMTIKTGSEQSHGGFTLLEALQPAGFATPLHVHRTEDEAFYLLEGRILVTCGDDRWEVEPGGFVFLPRGVPHGISIPEGANARLLQITSPAQFEHFVAEAGDPAPEAVLPPPSKPDIPRMLAAAPKYGYDILGAPPGS